MSLASLSARLNRVIARIDEQLTPKTWLFICEAGKELPDHVRQMFAPGDSVIIEEIPANYFGPGIMPEGYTLSWVK